MSKRIILSLISILFMVCAFSDNLPKTHTIVSGDSFESIAKRYNITVSQLRSRNPRVDACNVGLMLEIPGSRISDISYFKTGQNAPGYKDYMLWKEYRFSNDKKLNRHAGEYLKKAYDAGYYDAVLEYSKVLEYGGHGVKKNPVKSLSVLFAAASKGHPDAKWKIFERGNYTSDHRKYPSSFPSEEVMMIWLQEAADANVIEANYDLAHHHLLGLHVDKDTMKATTLYEKILLVDSIDIVNNVIYKNSIASLTELRSYIKGNSNEVYAKAAILIDKGKYDLAHIYFLKGSDMGHVKSMVSLAKDFEIGRGVYKDERTALKWYESAARKNDTGALAAAESLKKKLTRSVPANVPDNHPTTSTTSIAKVSSDQRNNSTNKSKFLNTLNKIGKVVEAVGETAAAINNTLNNSMQTDYNYQSDDQPVYNENNAFTQDKDEAEKNRKNKEHNKLYVKCCDAYHEMVKQKMELHNQYGKLNNQYLDAKRKYLKLKAVEMEWLYDRLFKECQNLHQEIRNLGKKMRKYRKDCYETYKITIPFHAIETKTPNFRD